MLDNGVVLSFVPLAGYHPLTAVFNQSDGQPLGSHKNSVGESPILRLSIIVRRMAVYNDDDHTSCVTFDTLAVVPVNGSGDVFDVCDEETSELSVSMMFVVRMALRITRFGKK